MHVDTSHELAQDSEPSTYKGRLPELLGTYVTCQARHLDGRDPTITEAAEHVKGCDWCLQHLFGLEELRHIK